MLGSANNQTTAEDGARDTILQNRAIVNLPVAELEGTLSAFLEPVSMHLPEKRLQEVGKLAVQGIIGGQSPVVTQMARGVVHEEETIWPRPTDCIGLYGTSGSAIVTC